MPRLDPATRNIVIGRLQTGQSQHEVARTLNVNQSTISRLWNRFQQTGSSNDRPRSGRPKKPYYGAALTPLHRHERVRWCNRLRGWPFRNRRRIWFSDYSRFLLQKRDGRIRVYRRRNERFSFSCFQEVDSYGGGSVMMWAVISNDSKAVLVHVPGNLTAVRYKDEILQPHLMHVFDRQRELFQ